MQTKNHENAEHDDRPAADEAVRGTTAAAFASGLSARAAASARATAEAADKVASVITGTASAKRVPTDRRAQSDFLRAEAANARVSVGPNGKSGRRGQLKGHLFEDLDIEAYNRRHAKAGRELRKNANPRQAVYDADRYVNGRRAGSVQHKSSPAGVRSAIDKMERKAPGSASRGTIRVPADQYEATKARAGGRTRVDGSAVTSAELEGTLDRGLDALARDGARARSKTRAAAKSAGRASALGAGIGGASEARALLTGELDPVAFAKHRAVEAGEAALATTVGTAAEKIGQASSGGRAIAQGATRSAVVTLAVSSVREVPALIRGDLSARSFAENRGVDAAETATATAVGAAVSGALLASASGGAAAAAVGSATAGAAASAAALAAGTGTAAGAGAAAALAGVSAAAAGPAIVGGVAMIGSGVAIGKGFRLVRKRVKERQRARLKRSQPGGNAPDGAADDTPASPGANSDQPPQAQSPAIRA